MGRGRTALIVGGGVIGVTSAYALARDGWAVRLVDQHANAGMGASLGNGRQLSYSHTNALASPGLLQQIPRLLLGCDQAFRLRARFDRPFVDWTARFLSNCTSTAYRRNTLETLALADRSRRAMDDLLEEHAIDFDHRTSGKIVLFRSPEELAAARASMESKQGAGLEQYLLTAEQAIEREPTLAQSGEAVAGAIFAPGDATGDCRAFADGLLKVLREKYDVDFMGSHEVLGLARVGGETRVSFEDGDEQAFDLVVAANGWRAPELLAPLGHSLPIEPMKGYSFTAPKGNAAPQVSITDHKRRIVFTDIGDRMLIAGIAEMGKVDCAVDPARLKSMVASAKASLPEAADYSKPDAGWAGFRPMTPNSQPITRMLEPGIAVNAGHGMLGWTLAMGSSERLGEAVRAAY